MQLQISQLVTLKIQFRQFKQNLQRSYLSMISRISNNIVASTKFVTKNLNSNQHIKYSILNRYYFALFTIRRSKDGKALNPQQFSKPYQKSSNYKFKSRAIKKLRANINENININENKNKNEYEDEDEHEDEDDMTKHRQFIFKKIDMAIFHKINKKIKQTVTLKQLFNIYDNDSKNMHPLQHAIVFKKMINLKIVNRKSLVHQPVHILQQKQDQKFEQYKNLSENQKFFQKVIQNLIKNASEIPPETLVQIILCCCRLRFQELKNSSALNLLNSLLVQFNEKQSIQVTQVNKCIKLIIGINLLKDKIRTIQMVQYNLCQQVIKKLVVFVTIKILNYRTSTLCQLLQLCNQNTKIANSNFMKQIITQLLKRYKSNTQLITLLNLQKAIFNQPKLLKNILKTMQQTKSPQHNILVRIQFYITKNMYSHLKNPNLNTKLVVKHIQNLKNLSQKQIAILNQAISQMRVDSNIKKDQKKNTPDDLVPSFNIIVQHLRSIATAILEIYDKYLFQAYSTAEQKEAIISWVNNNQKFISQFFQLIKQQNLNVKNSVTQDKNLKTNSVSNSNLALQKIIQKLVSLLSQFYSELNFDTQLTVLVYVTNKNYTNRRQIIQIFVKKLSEIQFLNISVNSTLKLLQLVLIEQTQRFFRISNQGFKWINPLFKYVFLKQDHFAKAQALAYLTDLISRVIVIDKSYLQLFIKRYINFSALNRLFSKIDVLLIEKFRKKVFSKVARVRNPSLDHQYLDIDENFQEGSSWELRQKIYRKTNNCIYSFQLIMNIFGNIQRQMMKQGNSQNIEKPYKSLKQNPLFQQILINFQEQLRFVLFQELITYQNMEKIIGIEDRLDHKMNIPVINSQRQKLDRIRTMQNEDKKRANINAVESIDVEA